MDSLTQIVLGAACGEAVLGKKAGNKALLFGAIGGTIPDLDVLVGGWLHGNEIDAMLFHRGFMHSILFSVLAAFLLGWLVYKLYNSGKRLHTTTQKDWVYYSFGHFLRIPY
ncbi:metal-dependent hydrolase [Thalassobellus sediminis]|uniref:metal-dependent hydrolase n=1 Tax=Thalassobellus sediminis TaxID=3367753 RepID=UPI00378FF33D